MDGESSVPLAALTAHREAWTPHSTPTPDCVLVGLNPSHRVVLPGVSTLPQEGRLRG